MAAKSSLTVAGSRVAAVATPVGTLAALCDELSGSFAERRSVIRAAARAILAGEHTFILGEPGTGKSLLVRCFAQALGLSYWEYLMTRFTVPDEVFGPQSITQLQKDIYLRCTAGYLPDAQIVFLDEIWKSNSGILNALLTALNERVFHNGGKPTKLPLVSLFSASNELPESESELGALYDRFLVRLVTNYVEDRDAFQAMVFSPTPVAPKTRVEIVAEQAAAAAVTIPSDVHTAIVDLRYRIRDAGLSVSDRRWRQIVALVRAAAHLEGRTVATCEDLECLEDVLWAKPDQRTEVARIIQEVSNPAGAEAVKLLDQAKDLRAKLPAVDMKDEKSKLAFLSKAAQANGDLQVIVGKLAALPASRKVTEARSEAAAIRQAVIKLTAKCSGLDVD